MITELVLGQLFSVVGWIGGLFPHMATPSWLANSAQWLAGAGPIIAGTHNWIAVQAISNAVVWLLSLCGVIIAIRLIRIIASFLTAGGGSAA